MCIRDSPTTATTAANARSAGTVRARHRPASATTEQTRPRGRPTRPRATRAQRRRQNLPRRLRLLQHPSRLQLGGQMRLPPRDRSQSHVNRASPRPTTDDASRSRPARVTPLVRCVFIPSPYPFHMSEHKSHFKFKSRHSNHTLGRLVDRRRRARPLARRRSIPRASSHHFASSHRLSRRLDAAAARAHASIGTSI